MAHAPSVVPLAWVGTRGLPWFPGLSGTGQQEWTDREQDIQVSGESEEVGRPFALRWADRLPPEQEGDLLAQLHGGFPRIPGQLDGELLRYAAQFGTIEVTTTWISATTTASVRRGFWDGIAAARP